MEYGGYVCEPRVSEYTGIVSSWSAHKNFDDGSFDAIETNSEAETKRLIDTRSSADIIVAHYNTIIMIAARLPKDVAKQFFVKIIESKEALDAGNNAKASEIAENLATDERIFYQLEYWLTSLSKHLKRA